jgi:rubrerythrin
MEEKNLHFSKYLGKASNSGEKHKGGIKKRIPDEVLILNLKKKNRKHTKRALIEKGRPYICEICGLLPEWNGKILTLQLDHKNGNGLDDREENLRFVCPNCHSQTETFCGRNCRKN